MLREGRKGLEVLTLRGGKEGREEEVTEEDEKKGEKREGEDVTNREGERKRKGTGTR